MASMVRPTRSIVVTGIPISAAHPGLESAEKEISCRPICRQVTVCIPQGSGSVTNAWAIPKVAGQVAGALRKLPDVDARFIGNSGTDLAAPESGVFRRLFAVQLHAMVRGYDARGRGRLPATGQVPAATDNLPRCGLLAR
ncbi:hypothetical protein I3J27_17040 [Bradyrhizobium xenonodulans]|uniref:Uncharacterized protein n=1 Tax=Bradyrhizobium xenonodulans TaxID=2736875 RepID=A0ABY7MUF1_9BRAD|nr:hypothetical protein [Bradyrhizobium xenonodulans]WBL82042.1 hypothetical protein I3J27_17040 [Bradyrhizobium xenonodulans]